MRTFVTLIFVTLSLAPGTEAQSVQPAFSITISPSATVVTSGNEVTVKIILKNTSDHPIRVWRAPGEDQGEFAYQVVVLNEKGDALTKRKPAKSSGNEDVDSMQFITRIVFTVASGEVLKDGVVLSRLYDLSNPGQYTVYVERTYNRAVIKSNSITLTVTP